MVRTVWSGCMGGAPQGGFGFHKWNEWWLVEGREERLRRAEKEKEGRREEKMNMILRSQDSRLES